MLKNFRLKVGNDKAYSRLKSLSVRFLPVSIGTPNIKDLVKGELLFPDIAIVTPEQFLLRG
jgi:hypothetical protein